MLQSQVAPFTSSDFEDGSRDSKRCERVLAIFIPQHQRSTDMSRAAASAPPMLKEVLLSRYPACVLC